MGKVVRVPDIGDATDVEVVELCAEVGTELEAGDPLIVLESDKASMEVPTDIPGRILRYEVALGDVVQEGQPIAEIEPSEAAVPTEVSGTEATPEDSAGPQEQAESQGARQDAGAIVEVRVPDVGDAHDVTVVEVCTATGAEVRAGDPLVVLESDKASMEIEAPQAGRIERLAVAEGDAVEEGTLIAILAVSGAPLPVPEQAAPPTPRPQVPAPGVLDSSPPAAAESKTTSRGVHAGPAVRRMARELGVDLSLVTGTGARNRILKEDVQNWVKARLQGQAGAARGSGIPEVPLPDFSKFGPTELEPLSRIMRAGGANLHRAWLNLPHVTHNDEADVTDLESFRAGLKAEAERRGVRLTPLAFIVKACVAVLKQFPRFNASLDAAGENFVLKRYYNIGLAVDTPQGLLVPVIKEADQKGLWEIAAEIIDLSLRARDGKLRPDDLTGGSFSISSLGALGGTSFTPIINAPEVAILGVAKTQTKPLWDGTAFVPRQMLPLSLSYDHRAINGADAARFTTALAAILSDIRRLALE